MKKIFILMLMGLGLLVSAFDVTAQPIRLARVDREQVALLEAKVARDLAQDTFKKRLVLVAALAGGAYLGYRYFNPSPVEVHSLPASVDQVHETNALLRANLELLIKNQPEIQQAGTGSWLQESTLGKFGSWMWETTKLYSNQAFIAYMCNVLLLGSSSTLTKMIKTVDTVVDSVTFNLLHDRDIKWFLISRASVTRLFNELETHAYCLQTGLVAAELDVEHQEQVAGHMSTEPELNLDTHNLTLDVTSYAYHMTAFEQTWKQLAYKLASLVAFIEHKAHATSQSDIQERLLIGAQHIAHLTNATAAQCETLLKAAHPEALPKDVLFEVRRLRASVSDELLHANKLEHEMSW